MIGDTDTNTTLPLPPPQGVFVLDDSEQTDPATTQAFLSDTERSGACLATWDEPEETDLPLIVWLRGDEPWYPQFDLDADAVMQKLGIKRSRLTQISGKDLRVGRVRVDRYIRPIFRSVDVEAYLQWTRATASHQKSSSAIKEAVDALQEQGSHIAQVVSEASLQFSKALEQGLLLQLEQASIRATAGLSAEVYQLTQTLTQQSLNAQTHLRTELTHVRADLDRQGSLAATHLTALDLRLDAVESATAAAALRLAAIADKLSIMTEQQTATNNVLEKLSGLAEAHFIKPKSTKTPRGLAKRPFTASSPANLKDMGDRAPSPANATRRVRLRRQRR